MHTPTPASRVDQEFQDVTLLPTAPLCRYYLTDCPVDENDEPQWVDAPSTVEAAAMASLLFGSSWKFSEIAWRSATTGKESHFFPSLDTTLESLSELVKAKVLEYKQ